MVPRRRRWSSRIHYETHPTRSGPTFHAVKPPEPGPGSSPSQHGTKHCSRTGRWCEFLGLGQGCRKNYTGRQIKKKCTTFSQQTKPLLSTGVKCQDYNGSFFPRGTRWQVWDAAAPNTKVLAVDCNISPPFGGGIVLKSFTAVLLLFPRWDMCVFEKGHLLSLWKFAAKRSLT